jgi:hypothetical protein
VRVRRIMLTLVALAVATQATACGARTGIAATPAGTASPTVSSVAPSTSAVARPLVIPDLEPSRFLQKADLGSGSYVGLENVLPADRQARLVSRACGTGPASEELVIERATMSSTYQLDGRPGGVDEIITRYQMGGAAQYLAEITAGVATCARVDHSESVWSEHSMVATGFAGDGSILVKTDTYSPPTDYSSGHNIQYQAVVRGDDAVLILVVAGWESTNPERGHADQLIDAAWARATA